MSRAIPFILALLITAAPAFAQEPAKKDAAPDSEPVRKIEKIEPHGKRAVQDDEKLRKTVDELVAKLGSDTFEAREDAYGRLEKLGPVAIPYLERHVEHEDAETRVRVKSLLEELRARPQRRLDLAPDDDDPLDGLTPRPPGGIRIDPLRPDVLGGDLDDLWKGLDRLFEDSGLGLRGLGARHEDLMRQHRQMMEKLERDLHGLSRGGMTLRIGPGGGASFSSSTSMTFGDEQLTWTTDTGGVRLDVRGRGGEESYTAKDFDAFKKAHPDVYARYKDSGIFERTTFRFEIPGIDPLGPNGAQRPRVLRGGRLLEDLQRLFGSGSPGMDRFGTGPRAADRSRRQGGSPPRLGVVIMRLPADVAARHDAKAMGAEGLWVAEVTRGSTAEKMGLVKGDVIVGVDGDPMNAPADLRRAVAAAGPGATIRVRVVRDGESTYLSGTLPGEKPERKPEPTPRSEEPRRIEPDHERSEPSRRTGKDL